MIRSAAVAATLLADAFAVAIVAELIAAGYDTDKHAVPAWAICVVAVAGYAIPRFVEGYDLSPRRAYAITGGSGLLLIYFLVRLTIAHDVALWELGWIPDFLKHAQTTASEGGHALVAGLLLLYAWARSSLRAADDLEMETVPRTTAIPFAVVTIAMVLGAGSDRSGEIARAGAAFYVAAILALALSQLSLSGATFGDVRAGSTAGILLAGAAAVAAIGLVLIALVTTILGPVVGPVLSTSVEWTLTIILTPLAWLLSHLFEWLFHGNNPFPNLDQSAINRAQEAGQGDRGEESTAHRVGVFGMRIVALFAMAAITAAATTMFLRLRKRRGGVTDEGRESLAVGDIRRDFGSMLRSLFHRRNYRESGYATTEATRLYLEVLARAESAGHARPEGETASEFAPVLQDTFSSPVTDEITVAFEAARYGGHEPNARALEELRRRWLEESGR